MEETIFPLAVVALSVLPFVAPVTGWLVLLILALECATIRIDSFAFSMALAIFEFAFVGVSRGPDKRASLSFLVVGVGHLCTNWPLVPQSTI